MHYHVIIGIDEEERKQLQEIAAKFLSAQFKGIGVTILPEDLVDERYREVLSSYILKALRATHIFHIDKDVM